MSNGLAFWIFCHLKVKYIVGGGEEEGDPRHGRGHRRRGRGLRNSKLQLGKGTMAIQIKRNILD